MESENLIDILNGRERGGAMKPQIKVNNGRSVMVKEKINPIIVVTFGQWHYEGDYRLIPVATEQIKNGIMPLFTEGNKQAMEIGLVPKTSDADMEVR